MFPHLYFKITDLRKHIINYYFYPLKNVARTHHEKAQEVSLGICKHLLTMERAYCRETAPTELFLITFPSRKEQLKCYFSFWHFGHSFWLHCAICHWCKNYTRPQEKTAQQTPGCCATDGLSKASSK